MKTNILNTLNMKYDNNMPTLKNNILAPLRRIIILLAILAQTTNSWALDEYVTITVFDASTTYSGTDLNKISGGSFSNTVNNVTFNIAGVSYNSKRLDYSEQASNSTVNSNFTWAAATNYSVSVSGVSIGLRAYQAKISPKTATAQFTDGTHSGLAKECKTNAVGTGGASTVSISASPIQSPLTLKKVTGGNSATYTITTVTFTYKVTYKRYQYGFNAVVGGVYNSTYGTATASGEATVTNDLTTTTASKQVTFTATPTNTTNYKFVGWYRDAS